MEYLDAMRLARQRLAEFSDFHELPAHLSDEGWCIFTFAERIEVQLHLLPDREAFYLYSPVGPLSLDARPQALLDLLAANHLWLGGDGATLVLDEGMLALERLVPLAELDGPSLGILLTLTVESVQRVWRDHADALEGVALEMPVLA